MKPLSGAERDKYLVMGLIVALRELQRANGMLHQQVSRLALDVPARRVPRKRAARRPYTRKAVHWTQRPENRAKVLAAIQRANSARRKGKKP